MFPKASNVRSMQIEFILLARVLCASSYFIFLFTHFQSLPLSYFSLAAQHLWRFLQFGFSFPFLRCNVNALSKQQSHVWCLHWKHRFADAIFHGISSGCHNWRRVGCGAHQLGFSISFVIFIACMSFVSCFTS